MVKLKNRLIDLKEVIFFHLILNVIFAVSITLSSYYHIPLNSFKGKLMYFFHLCLVQLTFAGVLYFLSLSRVVFKIVFPFLFCVLGLIAFWTYSINLSMSYAVLEAAISTKSYVIKDLISLQLVMFLFLLIGVLYFILNCYKRIEPRRGISLFLPLSCILFILFFWLDTKRTNSFSSKLPYSFFYSIKEYFDVEELSLKEIDGNLSINEHNKLKVVLVLGESLRADHLGLNGYYRQTTPLLFEKKNVISFNNIYTNKTNTALSVPCILTDKSIHYTGHDSVRSIYDTFNALKIPTYWVGNQLLESSYRAIVQTNNNVSIIDEFRSYWAIGKKRDMELLPKFNTCLNESENGLYTLHMIGSHWWYEDKYSDEFREYIPVIDSKYLPSLSKEQIVNSYDNTILYLDKFLDNVIEVLEKEKQPTVLIYISDHGESLGENGRWLHSHSEGLTKPGMIVWFSNTFKNRFSEKVDALVVNKQKRLSTDIVFHSLLDLLDTDQIDYNENLSIFKIIN